MTMHDGVLHELLGCAWGRTISTADDPKLCDEKAAQIVVLHNPENGREQAFKLCAKHRDRVLAETTPHAGGPSGDD